MTETRDQSASETHESDSLDSQLNDSKAKRAGKSSLELETVLAVAAKRDDDEEEDGHETDFGDVEAEDDEEEEKDASKRAGRPNDNNAIRRCIRAYRYAYNKKIKNANWNENQPEYDALMAGRLAYRRAMPPLADYENIRDFLACVAYATLSKVLDSGDVNNLRATARVALAALRCQPKHPEMPPKKYPEIPPRKNTRKKK